MKKITTNISGIIILGLILLSSLLTSGVIQDKVYEVATNHAKDLYTIVDMSQKLCNLGSNQACLTAAVRYSINREGMYNDIPKEKRDEIVEDLLSKISYYSNNLYFKDMSAKEFDEYNKKHVND